MHLSRQRANYVGMSRLLHQSLLYQHIQSSGALLYYNPLIPTLKPQSNGPLCSIVVIGTLAVDG